MVVLGLITREISTAQSAPNQEAMCRYIWTHSLAPGMDWENYLDLLVPLAYATLPPTVPLRRELLERPSPSDGKIQPRLPKTESRLEKWNWWWFITELPHILFFALGSIVRFHICPKGTRSV
jgi:hypothetical protein